MEITRGMNKRKFDKFLGSKTDDEFEAWLQHVGLLHAERSCPGKNGEEYGNKMKQVVQKGIKLWKCGAAKCRKELGFFVGTFFANQNLSAKKISLSFSMLSTFHVLTF
jgi:hypothetical protein